jgi:hypothetical protein
MQIERSRYDGAVFAAAAMLVGACLPTETGATTLFENPLNAINGNCEFQCGVPGTYAADNFTLGQASTVSGFTIDATGDVPASISLNWRIYSDGGTYLNSSATPSPLGTILYSGTVTAATTSFNPGGGYVQYAAALPSLSLASGPYWLALHDNRPVFNGDTSGPTTIYWGFGFGDGVWAAGSGTAWKNQNDALTGAGYAFSITGDVNATPLPSALPLFITGLGVLGLVVRRKKVTRADVLMDDACRI